MPSEPNPYSGRTAADLARDLARVGEEGPEHTDPRLVAEYDDETLAWRLRHPELEPAHHRYGAAQFFWCRDRLSDEAWQKMVTRAQALASQLQEFGDEPYPLGALPGDQA